MMNKQLRELLEQDESLDQETIDQTVELSLDEYRREMNDLVRSLNQQVVKYQSRIKSVQTMYANAMDYLPDSNVIFYQLPNGNLGYFVYGRKNFGFRTPDQYE